MQIRSLGWEDPLEKEMATHSSILPWEILMDRGDWYAAVHGVAKRVKYDWVTKQHLYSLFKKKTIKPHITLRDYYPLSELPSSIVLLLN